MANISSYLAAIMAAVYGEDVRGSIHDAIDIINKVGEVVLNTGTAVTGPTSSSTGFYDGSFYINTNTMELWKCIGTNSWLSQGVLKGADGSDGNGIVSIVKTSTSGLVDTYTITFDDGSTTTYDITNGQNGSKWYKGTAISGTGSSITGFPGVKDDYYLNSTDGYVYVCTRTGGASVPDPAEWDYVMTLTGGGGGSITVIDSLTSTNSTDALSANQGRVLNEKKIADPTTKSSGDVLTWDGSKWDATAPSGGSLSGLSDTNITSVADDQFLRYDSGSSKWVNETVTIPDVAVDHNGTASTSTVSKQRIKINSTYYDVDGSVYMESAGVSGTSYVFTNAAILATSAIDVYTDTWGDNPSNVTSSAGSVTVTFAAAQTRTVRIYIK